MGFTVQAILKRVPVMLSPALGGLLIARLGLVRGMRASLLVTVALALTAILAQRRLYNVPIVAAQITSINLLVQFRALHRALKRLLVSDIFIRTCEGMVSVFVVLYATNVIGICWTPLGRTYFWTGGSGATPQFIQSGRFQINVSGQRYPVTPHLRAPYDPERKKILS